MKKAIVAILIVVVILAAIFFAIFIAPQFGKSEYAIKTPPTKTEYSLVEKTDNDGNVFLVIDGKWDTTGLEVVKINKMGQQTLIDAKEYRLTFPSNITAAGIYTIEIKINDTEIVLNVQITVVLA